MITAVLDLETTGLFNKSLPHSNPEQPEIVAAAVQLYAGKAVLATFDSIVHGSKLSHPRAEEVHGIDAEMRANLGIDPIIAIETINSMLLKADRIVMHNADFDANVLLANCIQRNTSVLYAVRYKPLICTMRSATNVCKIPKARGSGYKYPKLIEAYKFLVNANGFSDRHTAINDVMATHAVLCALEANGAILEEVVVSE